MSKTKDSKMLKVCLAIGLVVVIINPTLVAASTEAGTHGQHVPSFSDIIPYWINFSLYVLILWKLLSKPVSRSWATRTREIEEAVNKGERARDEALQLLENAKTRRLSLSQTQKELEEDILHSQEHEVLEIIKDGMERAARVTAQSQDMVKAEQKSFEASLRSELSDKVLGRAKEILYKKIDAQSDKKLRDDARQGLPELLN